MKPAWARSGRNGPVRKFRDLSFFACEGLIAIYDARDGEYVVAAPDDFTYRADGLAAKSRTARHESEMKLWQRLEQRQTEQFANDARAASKEAKAMGDPSDPLVQAWWRLHSRKTKVSLSAGTDKAGYPDLPIVDLGKFTGKTATIEGVATHVDNVPKIHQGPRRKARGPGLVLSSDLL